MSLEDYTEDDLIHDTSTSATLNLPDGRKLGYAEYGARDGVAVFYLGGWPSARLEAAGLHEPAIKVGLHLISVDRPGLGWSSPQPNRTLLDHPKDIEVLANHFKLEKYGVLGISGGGPYALACAKALPADKLRAVSIVCGLGPPDIGYWGMHVPNYCGWTFVMRLAPRFSRWYLTRAPEYQLHLSDRERMEGLRQQFEKNKHKMPAKDVPFASSTLVMRQQLQVAKEVFAQGEEAIMQDQRLLSSDFGFRVQDIRKDLPVQIWHGTHDGNVPLNHAIQVQARLGRNADLRVKDETHASIWFNWREDFLRELANAIRA